MAAKKTSTVAKANGAMAGSGKRTYVGRRKNSVSDVRAMANARVVSVTGSLSALKSNRLAITHGLAQRAFNGGALLCAAATIQLHVSRGFPLVFSKHHTRCPLSFLADVWAGALQFEFEAIVRLKTS